MSKSKRQRGAYYLNRAIKYWENLGWETERLEIPQYFFIKGKMISGSRKDLLGADLCIWKNGEFFLIQVKSTDGIRSGAIADVRLKAIKQFREKNVPLKKKIMIWKPRMKPLIEDVV